MTVDASLGREFLLKVEGFELSSLSLGRVRTYIQLVNNLVGKQKEGVHLSSLKNGSLEAQLCVAPQHVDQVNAWLYAAGSPLSGEPRQAFEKFRRAILRDGGTAATATIIDIRTRETVLTIDPQEHEPLSEQIISQKDILRGRIAALGEVTNGNGYTGVIVGPGLSIRFTYDDSIAALLKPFLWAGTIELSGNAKWIRNHVGQWKLARFEATGVRELQQNSLKEIRARIKKNGGFGFQEQNLDKFLKDIR